MVNEIRDCKIAVTLSCLLKFLLDLTKPTKSAKNGKDLIVTTLEAIKGLFLLLR